MQTERTALILGASGLTGGFCLEELLKEPRYGRVVALVRRPLKIRHPKLEERALDADVSADDLFSCLGTTRAKTPLQARYRTIDLEIPCRVARDALRRGAKRLMLVSSAGADASSSFFYPRLKGEIDAQISKMPFEAVHIFRPSLLLGRRAEARLAEQWLQKAAPWYAWLCVGPWRRYRPIAAETVAQAMVRAALSPARGTQVHEFDRIAGAL